MTTVAPLARGIALVCLLLAGCAPTEAQIAKALQETQAVIDSIAQGIAETQAAALLLIPSDTHIPPTLTNTATPEVTSTSTPPPGQAYVPDLVGLNIEDAKATCSAADLPFFWVELINKDVPEWSVFAQTPAPGGLVRLDAERSKDKLKLLMSVYRFTPTPPPPQREGSPSPDPCGGITWEGICNGNVVYWCEDDTLFYSDCGWCGGFCMWHPIWGHICSCWL